MVPSFAFTLIELNPLSLEPFSRSVRDESLTGRPARRDREPLGDRGIPLVVRVLDELLQYDLVLWSSAMPQGLLPNTPLSVVMKSTEGGEANADSWHWTRLVRYKCDIHAQDLKSQIGFDMVDRVLT
jgi:hypothetical protein